MAASFLEELGVKISLLFDKEKAEEAQKAIKKIGDELRHTALEAAGAAAAIFAIGNNFTSNARELQNQADMLGVNTKQLQEYEYAAKVAANVNREELVSSLQHVGDMMDKARAGDADARQALIQLAHAGIGEQAMLAKLSDKTYTSADAMKDLSLGFQNISKTSPMAANRLAEFAFGSAKLMPLLRQGPGAFDALAKEADKNFVLNDKMIKQGKELDVQFTKIWLTLRKFAYEIGFNVAKHIKPMVDMFIKWFEANKKVIESNINDVLDVMVEILKVLFDVAKGVWNVFNDLAQVFGGIGPTVKLIVEAFLAFKALSFLASIFSVLMGLPALAATIVSALAPIGTVLAAIFSPVGAIIAAIGAAIVAAHDLYVIYEKMKAGAGFGDAFKDTWTGKGIEKVKDWMSGFSHGPIGQAMSASVPVMPGAGMGAPVTQENHFNTHMTVQVPHGTTPSAAAGMISDAAAQTHEKMLIKAKMDGARRQVQ